jgi:hypothetical protein
MEGKCAVHDAHKYSPVRNRLLDCYFQHKTKDKLEESSNKL